jgi:predicted nucleic acid-binding protein
MGARDLTTLDSALSGVTTVAFDKVPFIYYIELHPDYVPILDDLFHRVDSGLMHGVSSVVTLTEVLTRPKQTGDQRIENAYRSLLLNSRNFSLIGIDAWIAERAADLRAKWSLRTPDALQIATAIDANCQAFFTNDHRLRHITDIQVLMLDDLSL